MSDEDGMGDQRAEAPTDRRLGERSGTGEPRPAGSPSGDPAAGSDETVEKELLCTICGLRACWQ